MSDPRVTIAVCYKAGTKEMLKIWLASVFAYTKSDFKIVVVTADDPSTCEALEVLIPTHNVRDMVKAANEPTSVTEVRLSAVSPARIHGAMLDAFLASNPVTTEFLLTMDSDCFPVADGWLDDLEGMMDNGARVAGILHPWSPPPADMDHKKIEWRVRSQHCWETTHVACQMIRVEDLKELGVTFAGGDDTGLLIPLEARKRGWKVDGYKVTRCAKPKDGSDPEFNRYVCLIFGDAVYHHGGFTRIATGGDKPLMAEAYGWVGTELTMRREAEFLLSDEFSYRFKFDREEAVAAEKMDRLFGAKTMSKT